MKRFYIGLLILGFEFCFTFEEKIYTPPTQIQNILILPFVEEGLEDKSFLEKKASPNFYLGFGFAHNVHQLASQSSEIHSIPLSIVSQEMSLDLLMKQEKEVLEIWKNFKTFNIQYIVLGSFKIEEKDRFKITTRVYNLQNLEQKKIKSKTLTFQEVSKEADEFQYTKFLKTGLYPEILKFVLCFKVTREACVPIQKEEIENFEFEETTQFSEFLAHSRGIYHFYEFIHLSENKLEQAKEKQSSEIYLKKAIFSSQEKGTIYKNAIQSFVLLQATHEIQRDALNLNLNSYRIFYTSSQDPLKPELDQEEAENLRSLLNKSLRFIRDNPEYRIFVTGTWSKEPENKDQISRATSFIEMLYGKQNANSENSPYIFQDILGEEDSTKIEIRKVEGGK